jgi:hypothetical protein
MESEFAAVKICIVVLCVMMPCSLVGLPTFFLGGGGAVGRRQR